LGSAVPLANKTWLSYFQLKVPRRKVSGPKRGQASTWP